MTKLLLITLACHSLAIATGLGLIQLCSRQLRINVLFHAPFAWGIGVVLIYLLSKLILSTADAAPPHWHIIVLFVCILISAAGLVLYFIREPAVTQPLPPPNKYLLTINIFIIFIVIFRVGLTAYTAILNPVIDSDAAIPYSYTSLSRHLILGHDYDTLISTYKGNWHVSLAIPLFNTWVGQFWERWHDSLAAFTWIFSYIGMIGIAVAASLKINKQLTVALICGYLFSELPLAVHHVVRPGFHDLPLAYFFMLGASVLLFSIDKKAISTYSLLLAASAITGMAATKLEGIVWSAWLLAGWGTLFLVHIKNMPWKKIMLIELAVVAVSYILYLSLSDFILENFKLTDRLRRVFIVNYDFQTIKNFFEIMLANGSFNIGWWTTIALLGITIIQATTDVSKILAIYVLALLFAIFYFCCFSGDTRLTIGQVNPPRFLLQVSGLMLVSYCLFVRENLFLCIAGDKKRL